MHLERAAFDFVESVSYVDNLTELSKKVEAFLKNLGGDYFIGGQIIFPGGALRPVSLFANHQHDWFEFYRKNHLMLEDPALHFVKRPVQPFTWSWVNKTFDLTAGERFVMNEPRNFKISDGLVVPIHGPGGSVATVSMAGQHIQTGAREVAAVQMTMTAAYNQALHITRLFETARPSKLTTRQRECLNWVQHGKSNRDIAAILGISVGTVKDHIDAAKETFGVGSRIEAVIAAHREKLLRF